MDGYVEKLAILQEKVARLEACQKGTEGLTERVTRAEERLHYVEGRLARASNQTWDVIKIIIGPFFGGIIGAVLTKILGLGG